jgi:hypothetical protein
MHGCLQVAWAAQHRQKVPEPPDASSASTPTTPPPSEEGQTADAPQKEGQYDHPLEEEVHTFSEWLGSQCTAWLAWHERKSAGVLWFSWHSLVAVLVTGLCVVALMYTGGLVPMVRLYPLCLHVHGLVATICSSCFCENAALSGCRSSVPHLLCLFSRCHTQQTDRTATAGSPHLQPTPQMPRPDQASSVRSRPVELLAAANGRAI